MDTRRRWCPVEVCCLINFFLRSQIALSSARLLLDTLASLSLPPPCTRTNLAAPRPAARFLRRPLALASAALLPLLLLLHASQRAASAGHAHAHAHVAMDGGMGGMSMAMTFSQSMRLTLWVDAWTTSNAAGYISTLAFLAGLAAFQEWLHAVRAAAPAGSARATVLYALNALCSYLLMLAVMTYNVGVLFAVVAGMAGGRHAVTRRARQRLENTEAQQPGAAALDEPTERDRLLGGGGGSAAGGSADACCVQSDATL